MVVGIDNWKDLQSSLMKDVHGFPPQTCRAAHSVRRRSNSLNSLQSFCSTTFSSDGGDRECPSGFLDNVPLPPDYEDIDEDWRLFGWLLDSADANSSMSCNSSCECTPRPLTPLPPLEIEIPTDSSLPEASDLLKIKRKPRAPHHSHKSWSTHPEEYQNSNSRKRYSVCSDSDTETTDDEDMFEYRAMTRSMAHYLECKRRRKIGAPMPEDDVVAPIEPKAEPEESYIYEDPTIKEEYSMDSEMVETPNEDMAEQYIEAAEEQEDVKPNVSEFSKGRVEVLRGIKTADAKRTKLGRPTNKEKKQIERETKKILKKQQKEIPQDFREYIGKTTCYCQKVFDPSQDYIKCSYCKHLIHSKCAKLSVSKAEKMSEWYCSNCNPNPEEEEETEGNSEELYCYCNKPYDPNVHYIGCNSCNGWFHLECAGFTTVEAVQEAGGYICRDCGMQSQGTTAEEAHDDGVYYV